MEALNGVFDWLIRASWQAAVLVAIVLFTQWLFRKWLSPGWRYALWLLVLARLVMPVSPQSPLSLFNISKISLRSPDSRTIQQFDNSTAPRASLGLAEQAKGELPATGTPAPAIPSNISDSREASPEALAHVRRSTFRMLQAWLPLIWLSGVCLLALRMVWQNTRFARRVLKQRQVTNSAALDVLEDCKQAMNVRTPLTIIETQEVKSPALYGFVRPRLVLPQGMLGSFTTEELGYIFLHELAHVKRCDMAVNWLVSGLRALHWFNPILWFAFRRMAADREVATDALALSRAPQADQQSYGQAIIKLLEGFTPPTPVAGLVGILEDKRQMERRIAMIARFSHKSHWSAAIPLVLALSIALVGLTEAQTDAPATDVIGKSASAQPLARQVWAPAGGLGGSVSADGRYLSFMDGDSGDLAVRDLVTGTNRRITNKGSWKKSDEFVDESVFAPDGKRLAYSWFDGNTFFELRVISLDDAQPRILARNDSFDVWDWSPDGKRIIATAWRDYRTKGSRLLSIASDTGEVRLLKEFRDSGPKMAKCSPDGRFVAISYRGEKSEDLALLELESGTEIPLVQDPAEDSLVGWTPDGSSVLFVSDRRGTKDLWAVPIRERTTTGLPVLVKADFGGGNILGISRNGQLWFGVSRWRDNAMAVVDIDFATGKSRSGLRSIAHPAQHVLHGMDLSPNGRYAAFATTDHTGPPRRRLFVLDLDTRVQRELVGEQAGHAHGGRWLADNRTLFQRVGRPGHRETLSLFDTQTGRYTDLGTDDHGPWAGIGASGNFMFNSTERTLVFVRWSSEKNAMVAVRRELETGQSTEAIVVKGINSEAEHAFHVSKDLATIFYSEHPRQPAPERPHKIFRYDLKTGSTAELARSTNFLGVFPAPDPERILIAEAPTYWERILRMYSMETDPPTQLWSAHIPAPVVACGWTSDGGHFVLRGAGTENDDQQPEPSPLTLVSISGQVTRTELKIPQMGYLVGVRPNGEAFLILRQPRVSELWVMENFLPKANALAK